MQVLTSFTFLCVFFSFTSCSCEEFEVLSLDELWNDCKCGEVNKKVNMTLTQNRIGPRVKTSERRPWMAYLELRDKKGTRKESTINILILKEFFL